jgi:acetyl-CoA decarbonylase/synthase complex subunit beta
MAGQTGGGKQIVGFLGIGINYFRSPKFIAADGGWNRVGWMPKHLKDRVLDDIPADIVDMVATEEDATDLDSLKAFLIEKKHPIVAEWKTKEEAKVKVAEKAKPAAPAAPVPVPAAPVALPAAGMMPVAGMSAGAGGGIKIILKNAKINIEQVIVEQVEE